MFTKMTFSTNIRSMYGDMIYKETTRLQLLKKQAANTKCKWIFLERCVHHSILPKSFRTRPLLQTQQGRRITHAYNLQILKSTCSKEKRCYHQLLTSIKALSTELKALLSPKDFEDLCKITDTSRENAFIYQRSRLKEKF